MNYLKNWPGLLGNSRTVTQCFQELNRERKRLQNLTDGTSLQFEFHLTVQVYYLVESGSLFDSVDAKILEEDHLKRIETNQPKTLVHKSSSYVARFKRGIFRQSPVTIVDMVQQSLFSLTNYSAILTADDIFTSN